MPRRQAKKEVPRWRRGQPKPAHQINLGKRQQKALVREVARQVAAQPGAAPVTAAPQVNGFLGKTRAYRFRRFLPPFAWAAWVLAAGLGTGTAHNIKAALVLAGLTAAGIWLFTRHMDGFRHHAWQAMAVLSAFWIPVLCLTGFAPPWPHLLVAAYRAVLAVCALVVIVPWVRHFRRIPEEAPPAAAPQNDYVRWNLLTAEKRWNASLGMVEELPGGGRRYPVRTDGIKTTIGNIVSAPENIAGAWHKPMTEAYAERSADGITSSGYLTVLGRDTLMRTREWNGKGIDPQTGTAIVGRFADGSAAHFKFFTPRFGTRHALISGTTGSGKSEVLNLLLFIAIECGYIVPVVLDPQEGQSLPYWRDRCLYAAGKPECLNMLRGLHAGMLDRSRYLSSLKWDDDGVPMRGMGMFDHVLTGLPIVLVIFDEAHMLLAGDSKDDRKAVQLTLDIGRLGRKTGEAMWLATHLPGLSELGGEQALRDMLRGGNAWSGRTANRVAGGMLGLEKDPSLIPQYFADGKETAGLGYIVGPDNRPDAPMRTDLVPKAMKRCNPVVPALDDRFREAMDRAMAQGGVQLAIPSAAPLAAVPPQDDEAPPGRTAADAILAVLDEAGAELDRGEIIIRAGKLVTGQWGRAKPFSMGAWRDALRSLTEAGRITKTKHGTYAPVRASLHVVSGSDHTESEATGA
jgi:hypothetical protein